MKKKHVSTSKGEIILGWSKKAEGSANFNEEFSLYFIGYQFVLLYFMTINSIFQFDLDITYINYLQ